jgi:hypothetical protein
MKFDLLIVKSDNGNHLDFIRTGFGPNSFLCSLNFNNKSFVELFDKLYNVNWQVPHQLGFMEVFFFHLFWGRKACFVYKLSEEMSGSSYISFHCFKDKRDRLSCYAKCYNASPFKKETLVLNYDSVLLQIKKWAVSSQ